MKLSQYQKAVFLEQARNIIAKDRELRKQRMSNNTVGEVARALERAYNLGFSDAKKPENNVNTTEELDDVISIIEIPPRARKVFEELCMLSWDSPRDMDEFAPPKVGYKFNEKSGRWYLIGFDYVYDSSVAAQSVAKLEELDLIFVNKGKIAILNEYGWEVWMKYLDETPGICEE